MGYIGIISHWSWSFTNFLGHPSRWFLHVQTSTHILTLKICSRKSKLKKLGIIPKTSHFVWSTELPGYTLNNSLKLTAKPPAKARPQKGNETSWFSGAMLVSGRVYQVIHEGNCSFDPFTRNSNCYQGSRECQVLYVLYCNWGTFLDWTKRKKSSPTGVWIWGYYMVGAATI